jgi:hypothetical protein
MVVLPAITKVCSLPIMALLEMRKELPLAGTAHAAIHTVTFWSISDVTAFASA